jgi:hypothetical protein
LRPSSSQHLGVASGVFESNAVYRASDEQTVTIVARSSTAQESYSHTPGTCNRPHTHRTVLPKHQSSYQRQKPPNRTIASPVSSRERSKWAARMHESLQGIECACESTYSAQEKVEAANGHLRLIPSPLTHSASAGTARPRDLCDTCASLWCTATHDCAHKAANMQADAGIFSCAPVATSQQHPRAIEQQQFEKEDYVEAESRTSW